VPAAFLPAYRKSASIPSAAQAAGIRPAQHCHWLANAGYWQAFAAAQEKIAARLQDAVLQRAMQGWEEPVVYRGRVCGTIWHYSERLLLFLLRASMPETWG
jgi:hypothetical protein